jgi:hypothetical protein
VGDETPRDPASANGSLGVTTSDTSDAISATETETGDRETNPRSPAAPETADAGSLELPRARQAEIDEAEIERLAPRALRWQAEDESDDEGDFVWGTA